MLRWAAVYRAFLFSTRGRIGCHLICMASTSGLLMQWRPSTSLFSGVCCQEGNWLQSRKKVVG